MSIGYAYTDLKKLTVQLWVLGKILWYEARAFSREAKILTSGTTVVTKRIPVARDGRRRCEGLTGRRE